MVPEMDNHIFELTQRLKASDDLNVLLHQRLDAQENTAQHEIHKLHQEVASLMRQVKSQAEQEMMSPRSLQEMITDYEVTAVIAVVTAAAVTAVCHCCCHHHCCHCCLSLLL